MSDFRINDTIKFYLSTEPSINIRYHYIQPVKICLLSLNGCLVSDTKIYTTRMFMNSNPKYGNIQE